MERGFGWTWRKLVLASAKATLFLFAFVCKQAQLSDGLLIDTMQPNVADTYTSELPDKPRQYLYPMLIFGPNNQLTGLKEMLVLGRFMSRTVIVPDIKISHPLDASSENDNRNIKDFLEFDTAYDYTLTASRRDVVTLAERLMAGWNGSVDAVVYYTQHWLPYWKENLSLNVSVSNATWLNYGSEHTVCTEAGIANLTELIKPYNTVGFIMFKNLVWDAGYGVIPGLGRPDMCRNEYTKVSGDIAKSAKTKEIARAFREKSIGGDSGGRYMAVHIRPYPDTCMALWRRSVGGVLPPDEANKDCHNPSLMSVFINQTLVAMERFKVSSTVFIMCHPGIRTMVAGLYGAAGITPLFYDDVDGLVNEFGFSCPSLLGMVEQELANQADVFLATKASSMSGIVVEERYAVNTPGQITIFFVGDHKQLPPAVDLALPGQIA
ncbi:hypothetical protein PLESTM_001896400 [Pleodorina starrii]|nr:hypothetical protein PLESTM_001896400 [Pleodorina starrii]